MDEIINKSKEAFFKRVKDFGSDPYHLITHIPEMERLAYFMFKRIENVDKEVVLLSVFLHDIGHYPLPNEEDHAIRSESISKEFLEKNNYPKEKMNSVLHCVRAHRCRDVFPETIEAKIIAFIDSLSHMFLPMYFQMSQEDKENNKEFRAISKIERDYRDLGLFPEIQKEFEELYLAWKKLIKVYDEINY